MDQAEALRGLREFAKLKSVTEVRTFEGYQETTGGGARKITVTIHDYGTEAETARYRVSATDGEIVEYSNPHPTIQGALVLNWDAFRQ
jgi:hypothetical protein